MSSDQSTRQELSSRIVPRIYLRKSKFNCVNNFQRGESTSPSTRQKLFVKRCYEMKCSGVETKVCGLFIFVFHLFLHKCLIITLDFLHWNAKQRDMLTITFGIFALHSIFSYIKEFQRSIQFLIKCVLQ